MVKIINQFGDVKKGKQHTAVYQDIYGNQMRRMLKEKKDEHTRGQLEQRERFKVGIDFAKGLTKAQRDFIKSYMAEKNIRSPDGLPTTWYSFTKKIAMTRPKVTITPGGEEEGENPFPSPYQNWNYRKPITLNNQSEGELTNFQTLITLTPENFSYSKCNEDGSDIRFSTPETEGSITALNYWIKDWNYNGTSKIKVKITSIPTGENACLSIYYGNTEATSESSGENTYIFFWNQTNLSQFDPKDSASWSVVEDNGINVIKGDMDVAGEKGYCWINNEYAQGSFILEVEIKASVGLTSNNMQNGLSVYSSKTTTSIYSIGRWEEVPNSWSLHLNNGGYFLASAVDNGFDASSWHAYKLKHDGANDWDLYVDDLLKVDGNYNWSPNPRYNGLFAYSLGCTGYILFSNPRIRKYASPDPTVSSFGEEEEPTEGGLSDFDFTIHHPAIKSYKLIKDGITVTKVENLSNLEDHITTSIARKVSQMTSKIVVKTLANQEYEFIVQ